MFKALKKLFQVENDSFVGNCAGCFYAGKSSSHCSICLRNQAFGDEYIPLGLLASAKKKEKK